MNLTVETSPTFKRAESTARWGEEKDSIVITKDHTLHTRYHRQFEYSSQDMAGQEPAQKYSTASAIVSNLNKNLNAETCSDREEVKEKLKSLFLRMIEKEIRVEHAKQLLYDSRGGRNIPYDMFMSMLECSSHQKKFVLFDDFKNFLSKRLGIVPEDPNILVDIFTSFDHLKECKLSLVDLQSMLLPNFSLKRKLSGSKLPVEAKDSKGTQNDICSQIIERTREVFQSLLELFTEFNLIKCEVKSLLSDLDSAFE